MLCVWHNSCRQFPDPATLNMGVSTTPFSICAAAEGRQYLPWRRFRNRCRGPAKTCGGDVSRHAGRPSYLHRRETLKGPAAGRALFISLPCRTGEKGSFSRTAALCCPEPSMARHWGCLVRAKPSYVASLAAGPRPDRPVPAPGYFSLPSLREASFSMCGASWVIWAVHPVLPRRSYTKYAHGRAFSLASFPSSEWQGPWPATLRPGARSAPSHPWNRLSTIRGQAREAICPCCPCGKTTCSLAKNRSATYFLRPRPLADYV
jgi:hypothetical protein